MIKYIVGIDEVGRGPLAGPVAVCAFLARSQRWKETFRGVKNSKALPAQQREKWFEIIRREQAAKRIDFAVSFVGPAVIDRTGISRSLALAIKRSLFRLKVSPRQVKVLLDGGIRAPDHFRNQRTIVKGDEKEPVIALASIVAKVKRDRHMRRLAKIYPSYGFEIHKGYGTKAHFRAIRRQGLCEIHRKSFLKTFEFKTKSEKRKTKN